MNDHILAKGHLDVGDDHKIYYEEWGNPKGAPIMHLHGGPGAGFNDSHKAIYDPKVHHVIFHDQRGSGKSTPFASTKNNTTQDLINDIEKLREHFGLETANFVGGSWGSSLALMYAMAHPQRVKSFLLWGVYLMRDIENNWVNEGYPRFHYPAEWERFIALVPEKHRSDGKSIMSYYAKKMYSTNSKEAEKYAYEWMLWECVLLSITYDPKTLEEEIAQDSTKLAISLLETHYFMNGSFVPYNYILDNLDSITHIPCHIVQGRFDMCTPPIGAYDLFKAYGKKATLQWVNSGHRRSDPEMLPALQKTAKTKLK